MTSTDAVRAATEEALAASTLCEAFQITAQIDPEATALVNHGGSERVTWGQYAARVRAIIERGCRSGRFSTRTPQIAAFAVLEMGNSAKSWFRPSGRYPDTYVASEYGQFALRVVG